MNTPSIFVGIAAYRDPDLPRTIADMLAQARFPGRVTIGVCAQLMPDEDALCRPPGAIGGQCREIIVDARESRGACWARHLVQTLWRGEEYVLQIDSHMRFVEYWDELLLDMLARCSSPKAVLSSYAPIFEHPDKFGDPVPTKMRAREFDDRGILLIYPELDPETTAPTKHPFVSAHLLFGPSALMREIPYDPFLYFLGEEITLSARLWTHGWDIYAPDRVVAYHDYTRRGRRLHWEDHARWTAHSTYAGRRIRHLFGMELSDDPAVVRALDKYGLGDSRSLAQYEAFSGIDFRRKLIDGKGTAEVAADAPAADRRERNRRNFSHIREHEVWGAEETRSGPDATLAATIAVRTALPRLLGFLGVEALVDAGCGDLNWMRHLLGTVRLYSGCDVVVELIDELRKQYGMARSCYFSVQDITVDPVPRCDAILCRDVLSYYSALQAKAALSLFRESSARYLIATTYREGSNDVSEGAHWRPMSLTAEPFRLPQPLLLIREDGKGKALGVWRTNEIPV